MQRRAPIWTSVYFLSALLVATPTVDLVTQVWPLQPGSMVWRYGFLGLLGNNLLTPLLGFTLAGAAAILTENPRALRILSWMAFGVGLGLVAVLGLFSLDVLQLRASVAPEAKAGFQIGAGIAAGKYALAVVGYLLLGGTARRSLPRPSRGTVGEQTRIGTAGTLRNPLLVQEIPG